MKAETKRNEIFLRRWSEGYLAALFFLLPLSLHRGYFDITETKAVCFAALTALYLVGVLLSLFSGTERRLSNAALLFLFFVFAQLLSSLLFGGHAALLASHNRYQGVWIYLLYGGMVCALSLFGHFGRWARRAALGTFALVALLCVLNALYMDPLKTAEGLREADKSRYLSTIGNVNFIGAYVSLLLPMALVCFCRAEGRLSVALCALVSFLGVGALLVGSDCGVLGVAAAAVALPWLLRKDAHALRRLPALLLLCAVALGFFGRLISRGIGLSSLAERLSSLPAALLSAALGGALRRWARDRDDAALLRLAGNYPVVPAAMALGGGVFLLLGNTLLRGRLPASIASLVEFSGRWGSDRGAIWQHCLTLYASFGGVRKLIGGGAGCLALYDMSHRLFPDAIIDSAHNEYLHYLLTAGALGLCAYLAALCAAFRRALAPEGEDTALLAALFGCAVQSVVNIAQCATTPLFFALLALLLRRREDGDC